jgi:HPt (histidine-containing phosphotransfer) domain-containing protein
MNHYAAIEKEVIESLKEIGADDPEFFTEIRSLYAKLYREKSGEIETMVAAGELKKVAATLHTIKSSSGSLGAMNFHGLCATIEKTALNGDAQGVAAELPNFQRAFALVATAIANI